jgi:hypothetical protein
MIYNCGIERTLDILLRVLSPRAITILIVLSNMREIIVMNHIAKTNTTFKNEISPSYATQQNLE